MHHERGRPGADIPDLSFPFDGFTARLIRRKARQLVGKAGFTSSDRPDIEQELVLKLLKQRSAFDPAKAPWQVFAVTVVERCAASLVRDRRAQKRDHRRVRSLHGTVCSRADGPTELAQALGAREYDQRRQCQTRSDPELAELRADLHEVLNQVAPELRELARALEHTQSTAEAARVLGMPRNTICGKIRRLRQRFERAGLRAYFGDF
jgi:RNA polymerase sigma-70 factor (ECF subfamily)